MSGISQELTADEIGFDPPFGDVVTDATAAGGYPSSWRLLDDVQILALPDPQFLVEGIIQKAGIGVIYAPSGAGKTTAIASLLTALATGTEWFGHRVLHPGASVYVATEDVSGFKVRLRAAKRAALLPLERPLGIYTFPEPIDLRDPVSVDRFRQFLLHAGVPFACIVVDTYAAATPGANENSAEDTTIAMVHAQQWRDALGATVIIVHHTNAGGSRERGHSAMRGAADFMISLTPVDDVIHLESSKQRNGPAFEKIVLKLLPAPDGEGCVMRLRDDVLPSARLSPMQQKAYEGLKGTFTAEGATKTEWQKVCHDVPERTFYHASKVLVEQGFVKQVGTHFRVTGKEPK